MKLLCDAIAFCYGPATALKVILETWHDYFDEIVLISTSTTEEYFSRCKIVTEMVSLDTEDIEALEAFDASRFDVYLCVCNPIGYSVLSRKIQKTVYVDFLFWMRTEGNAPEFTSAKFIAEKYPGYEDSLRLYSDQIPGLSLVAPLIKNHTPKVHYRENQIVVNLGGQRSKLTTPGVNSSYPELMIRSMQSAADMTGCDAKFVVTSDEQTSNELRESFEKVHWEFVSLEHNDFLRLLSKSNRLFTHPGLYSPFEGISHGCPTFFLPSSNYTQILQLYNFRKVNLASWSMDLVDLGLGTVPPGLKEEEGVNRVLRLVNSAKESEETSRKIGKTFEDWLCVTESELKAGLSKEQEVASRYLGEYESDLMKVLHSL